MRPGLVIILLVAGWCLLFPPFHLVRLQAARDAGGQLAFNAPVFVQQFWTNQLLKSLDRAADAHAVLTALAQDAPGAKRRYGQTLGLSSSTCFFLQGVGTVVSVEAPGVGVALNGPDHPAEVLLQTGLIFGNTVRDATGLLDVNGFPNSQDFNAISAELNHCVETQVIPGLKANAALGRRVRFVGCSEIAADAPCPKPLKLVPIHAVIEPSGL